MIKSFPLGHVKITPGSLDDFLYYVQHCIEFGTKSYCIPLNLTKYEVSKKDQKLRNVIHSADIVIADGIPINWLSHRLGYGDVCRVNGIELAESILAQSKKKSWKIYLLGSHAENLEAAVNNLNKKFDNPIIIGAHDGYFGNEGLEEVLENINSLKPDFLFLGLGMPQKEYFIHDYFNDVEATYWLPVGGAFDIWAHTKKRSPSIIQKMGLEWLQRSFYNKEKAKNILKYGFSFTKDFLFFKQ